MDARRDTKDCIISQKVLRVVEQARLSRAWPSAWHEKTCRTCRAGLCGFAQSVCLFQALHCLLLPSAIKPVSGAAYMAASASVVDAGALHAALDLLEDLDGNVSRKSLERLLNAKVGKWQPRGARRNDAKSLLPAWRSWREVPLYVFVACALVPVALRTQSPHVVSGSRPEEKLTSAGWPPTSIFAELHPRDAVSDGGSGLLFHRKLAATCTAPCILPAACTGVGTGPAASTNATAATNATATSDAAAPLVPTPPTNATNATEGEGESTDGEADGTADGDGALAVDMASPDMLLLVLAGLLLGIPFLISIAMTYYFCIKKP